MNGNRASTRLSGFTMHAEGDATRFVIDHDAIPPQWEDHIQSGYSAFYQDPLTRHFGG